MNAPAVVDNRPQPERILKRTLFACACVVAGFTLLGGASCAYVVAHLTRPKESR